MPKLDLRFMGLREIRSKIKELGKLPLSSLVTTELEYFGIIDEEHKKSNLFKDLFRQNLVSEELN